MLVEDNGPLRKIVERVCQSFANNDDVNRVYEINPKTVMQEIGEITA